MPRWWCSSSVAENVWLVSHQYAETEDAARSLHFAAYRRRYPAMAPATTVVQVAAVSASGMPMPMGDSEVTGAPA